MKFLIVLVAMVVLASARPETKQLNWQPKDDNQPKAQIYGGGGAEHRNGGGVAGFVNPNGSGAQVKYGHQSGFGQNFAADARVPIYTNKNRYGESTVNLGVGADYQRNPINTGFGDKRIGLSFNHRF
ncbi:hypothetical protein GWI33_020367 [Rhynchophorus ferrugineus]|uniref:Attacin C-terminal domain-containing protein n=1 Tax=Rhynchophorus ferrugineus TaxID=354439 RepID=A0A834M5Z7_RHYFE|nr:hypothetical protein GWI33_020367 [Rhynchophorus ferrugineus]